MILLRMELGGLLSFLFFFIFFLLSKRFVMVVFIISIRQFQLLLLHQNTIFFKL